MQHYKKYILIGATLFAFLCLSPMLWAQSTKTTLSKKALLKEWNKLDKFKEFVKVKRPDFPYYVALVYKGKVISEKTNSYANIEKKQPLNNKIIHRWGSVSKLFMTMSMLQLVERNKISLGDPITKWLPEVGKGVDSLGGMQAVKIYHLLNHTAGISIRKGYLMARKKVRTLMKKQGKKGFRLATIKEFIPYLKHTQQKRKPGAKYRYDNGGYTLLGIVLERVTKMGFREYVQQNIFEPLKMKNTSYYKVPENRVKQVETLYGLYPDEKTGKMKLYNNNRNLSQGMSGPNGGIKSTPEDMVKFMRFFRFRNYKPRRYKYDKVLKQATLNKYVYNIDMSIPNEKRFSTTGIGKKYHKHRVLGINRIHLKPKNSITYGHSGHVNFARSLFIFNKDQPFGLIMMMSMSGAKKTAPIMLKNKLFELLYQFALESNFGKLLKKLDTQQQK